MTFKYSIDDLIENFAFMEDWEDKYRYLLELGDGLEKMPESDKIDANKVDGCTSQVWLTAKIVEESDGAKRFYFSADSDAHIVKGLIAILLISYNGKTADEILAVNIEDIFRHLGLEENLSPTRRNGFFSMVQKIKTMAVGVPE